MTIPFSSKKNSFHPTLRSAFMECIIAPRCKSGVHLWSAYLHLSADMQCICAPHTLFKTLLYCRLKSRSAFMHHKKSLLYIILYSIYSIIYYLFVVLLLGFYSVFSSNPGRKNRPHSLPIWPFSLFPTHHIPIPYFSSFIITF
jgi:hypothetical protein